MPLGHPNRLLTGSPGCGETESFNDLFVGSMRAILDGDVPLLGTVAMKGGGFIAEVKQRADVELIPV